MKNIIIFLLLFLTSGIIKGASADILYLQLEECLAKRPEYAQYKEARIDSIKKKWNDSEIEPYFKKALGQTLDAYLRKEYALAIPFLATMWEGIIKSKVEKNEKKFKEKCKDLVDENGYDEVFSDFFNNLIFGQCYSVNDVVDGIPNRNGVAHSWYIKYPSQKAALNAILLTDFVLSLKPKNEAEDIEKE